MTVSAQVSACASDRPNLALTIVCIAVMFPCSAIIFPCSALQGISLKSLDAEGTFRRSWGSASAKNRIFPAFFPASRENPRDSSSPETASSAKQSVTFAFSAEKSKILRVSAILFALRVAENLSFGQQQVINVDSLCREPSRWPSANFRYY